MLRQINDYYRKAVERVTLFCSFLVQKLLYASAFPANFSPQRILVIKLDHFGDLLLSTAVFNNLSLNFPSARADALIGSWGQTVLENHPKINRLIYYNSPGFSREAKSFTLYQSVALLMKLWRQYDLVVDLRGDWLTVTFALLKSSPYRMDRATLQIENKLGQSTSTSIHESDRNLDLLRFYQLKIGPPFPTFHLSSTDQIWADAYLATLPTHRSIVVIHPGSPIALKRWPMERFAQLADWLITDCQSVIIFVGLASETGLVQRIQKQMRHDSIDLAGQTSLCQLGALLEKVDLFLGNDSAPMHLAAAVGVPVLALYGPSDPERFGPIGANCNTIRLKPDCPPCMASYCQLNGLGCMREISVAAVKKSVARIFQLC